MQVTCHRQSACHDWLLTRQATHTSSAQHLSALSESDSRIAMHVTICLGVQALHWQGSSYALQRLPDCHFKK